MSTQDLINAMVAEYEVSMARSADQWRKAEEEIEREKLVRFDQAVAMMVETGALTPNEVDALFADSAVELRDLGTINERILLTSVTLPGLKAMIRPRNMGDRVRLSVYTGKLTVGCGLVETADRIKALAVVAEAVRAEQQRKEREQYEARQRSQS